MLIRLVRCERGSAHVTVRLDAQPDYARRGVQWRHEGGALVTEDATLWLAGEPGPELDEAPSVST